MESKSDSSNRNMSRMNIEEQIASMLENVMNGDSEEDSFEEKNERNQCEILNFEKHKDIFSNEENSMYDNFDYESEKKINPQYCRRDKKFHSNNYLNTKSLHREVLFNSNDFQKPSKMIQHKIFINNIRVAKVSNNNEIDHNFNRENFVRIQQNPNGYKGNNPNICNNIPHINLKSQSQKTNNLFYKPLTLSPRMMSDQTVTSNLKNKHSRMNINQLNGNCLNQNFQNTFSLNQHGISNPNYNNPLNFYQNEKYFNNSNNNQIFYRQNNHSSTNSTFSHVSMTNNSNEQYLFTRFDDVTTNNATKTEFDEILENKIKSDEYINEENYELLKGKFYKVVTSQIGSRILQNCISKTSIELLNKIFDELVNNFNELIIDQYGNYFCQKFFCSLRKENRVIFLQKISENLLEIAKNKVGTYPLQAIIDTLVSQEEKKIIIENLGDKSTEMSLDLQAAHVVEKILINFNENDIEFIYEDLLENFMLLANHMKGLCVIKKVIQLTTKDYFQLRIRNIIAENALALVHNPYGNYAIQTALECYSNEFSIPIISKFVGKAYVLSMQKFSSNVIEKCLEKGDDNIITKFIDEICQFTRIIDLMKSSFGNYVVQKALKVATNENKTKLVDTILNNVEKLNERKLINKWKKIVNDSLGKFFTPENVNNNINIFNISPNNSFGSNTSTSNCSNPSYNNVNFNNQNNNINSNCNYLFVPNNNNFSVGLSGSINLNPEHNHKNHN